MTMHKLSVRAMTTLALAATVAACASAEPTPTPESPSATLTLMPTATAPPSATLTTTPTQTPLPTQTPTVVTATPLPPTATTTPLPPAPTRGKYDYDELVRQFYYDPGTPLDVQEESVSEQDGVQVHSISYASPMGGRVPAFLVNPPGPGPFAGIVFLHWGMGSRREFLDEAVQLAQAGAVSLLIDAPFVRPGPTSRGRAMYVQTVVDVQQGVSLLASRPDVDAGRIGFVGHSFGATWGGVLAGFEKRVRACVLMAGYARISENDEPTMPSFDAVHYLPHAAPAAILFQFARQDAYISEDEALLAFETASEPKSIQWYDSGHGLNQQARDDRVAWLSVQLGLGPAP